MPAVLALWMTMAESQGTAGLGEFFLVSVVVYLVILAVNEFRV